MTSPGGGHLILQCFSNVERSVRAESKSKGGLEPFDRFQESKPCGLAIVVEPPSRSSHVPLKVPRQSVVSLRKIVSNVGVFLPLRVHR